MFQKYLREHWRGESNERDKRKPLRNGFEPSKHVNEYKRIKWSCQLGIPGYSPKVGVVVFQSGTPYV